MKKVLLASSSNVFLTRNANLLKQRGIQLFTANSGAESLELHEKHHFDLIVSDYELNDMDGCSLCSLVRKEESLRHISIVLICHNRPDIIEKLEQSDANAILLKPIDPMKLLKTIEKFTGFLLVRSHRVELRVKVLCKEQKLEFFCQSLNVSNSGILIETEQQLELKSRIICQFTIPPSFPIEAEGEVIRSTRGMDGVHHYGIRFVNIQMSSQREILNYVSSIATIKD